MRTFIAIELPEAIKRHLSLLQQKLKSCGAAVTWVEPANIHLTLKFLGEIDEAVAEKVIAAMQDVAARHKTSSASLGTAGAFPRIESPRVIWAGLATGGSALEKLAADLETALAAIGIPPEDRPFSPHITLGRTRSAKNIRGLAEAIHRLAAAEPDAALAFPVQKLTLFKSTLTPRGPLYETLHEVPLTL